MVYLEVYLRGDKVKIEMTEKRGFIVIARWVCLSIGVLGSIFFAAMLAMLQLSPEKFGEMAEGFVVEEVEKRVGNILPETTQIAPEGSARERLLQAADSYLDNQVGKVDTFLDDGGPKLVASVLAAAGLTSCGCQAESQERLEAFLTAASLGVRASFVSFQARIVEEYEIVKKKLLADFMIFITCNLVAFLMVLGLAVLKGKVAVHLLPFALLLSGAIFLSAYWYLFGQNWFFTILFNDYWGISYAVAMAAVFAFLADIALNRARVTTMILNGITSVIGTVPLPIC